MRIALILYNNTKIQNTEETLESHRSPKPANYSQKLYQTIPEALHKLKINLKSKIKARLFNLQFGSILRWMAGRGSSNCVGQPEKVRIRKEMAWLESYCNNNTIQMSND